MRLAALRAAILFAILALTTLVSAPVFGDARLTEALAASLPLALGVAVTGWVERRYAEEPGLASELALALGTVTGGLAIVNGHLARAGPGAWLPALQGWVEQPLAALSGGLSAVLLAFLLWGSSCALVTDERVRTVSARGS